MQGVDMDLSLALAALELHVRRPTLAALIAFGEDLSHANEQAELEVRMFMHRSGDVVFDIRNTAIYS